jgi:hypothetical protein
LLQTVQNGKYPKKGKVRVDQLEENKLGRASGDQLEENKLGRASGDQLEENKLGRGQAEHLKPSLSETERAPAEINFTNCSKGQ